MGAGTKAAVVQPRPKKLYREKEERPAVGIKASAKNAASAKQAEAVSRNALQKTAASAGLTALGRAVPLAQLTRKELQARAIKAGLKANAKSADLVKALESFAASAAAGAALLQQPVKGLNFKVDAERAELAELAALGIRGKTPGGTRWSKKAHTYNLRSTDAAPSPTGRAPEILANFKI